MGKDHPHTQCRNSAKKHVVLAWTAWKEIGHENDNRDYCSGNLRLAAEHLSKTDILLAGKCCAAASSIENLDDKSDSSILSKINDIRLALWDSASAQSAPLDIIIPLKADESWRSQCDELKILLRSIEKNVTGLNRVCVVADCIPDWLNPRAGGLVWLPFGNPHRHNKDANLFMKMEKAISFLGITGKWVFSADDGVFLKPCDLRSMPIVYNGSKREKYEKGSGERKWYRRMVNTFDYLKSRGVEMKYSYDCHIPQAFDASTIALQKDVPYANGDGYCIYTLWRGLEGKTSGDVFQDCVSSVFDSAEDVQRVSMDKNFCNYTDAAFGAGLREMLFEKFSTPSHYEL